MPLTSTRGSASSTGYGQNLQRSSAYPYTGYGNAPYVPIGASNQGYQVYNYSIALSPDGTGLYISQQVAIGPSYSLTYQIACYSRNTSTGELTYVSTSFIYLSSIGSAGPSLTVSPDSKHLYLAYADNPDNTSNTVNNVYQFLINSSTKALTPLTPAYVTLPTGACPQDIVVSPDGNFVYTGSKAGNGIYILSRNSTTGLLTYSSVYNTPAGTRPWRLFASADNNNIYASSYASVSSAAILQYSRNTVTGALTPLSPEALAAGPYMRQLNFNPAQGGLHCGSQNGTVYIYGRNGSTGQLTLTATQGGTIYGVSFSPDGTRLLGFNAQGSGNYYKLQVQSGLQGIVDPSYGFITTYDNPNFLSTGLTTGPFVASPTYSDYYSVETAVTSYGFNSIYTSQGLTIVHWKLIGGYLTPVNYPAQTGSGLSFGFQNPQSLTEAYNFFCSNSAISPDGKSLYTNSYLPPSANAIFLFYGAQFDLDATTGVPTRSTALSYSNNQGPGGIVITANSSFLYQVDQFNSNTNPVIWQYSRDLSSGNLTALSTANVSLPSTNTGAFSAFNNYYGRPVLSPDQKNIYIPYASSSAGTASVPYIIQLTRDTGTGLLTYNTTYSLGSYSQTIPYNVAKNGFQAAVHPNNNFVFCTTQTGASQFGVVIFARNNITGALTQLSIFDLSPYVSTSNLLEMCMSPDGSNLYVNGNGRILILSVNGTTGGITYNKTISLPKLQYYTRLFMMPNGAGIITFLFDSTGATYSGCIVLKRSNSGGDLSNKYYTLNNFKAPTTVTVFWFNASTISSDSSRFYVCGMFVGLGYLNQ